MANTVVSPIVPSLLHTEQFARNGIVPHAQVLQRLASEVNYIAGRQKKLIFTRAIDLGNVPNSGSVTVIWPLYFRTGENTTAIMCWVGLARGNGLVVPSFKVSVNDTSDTLVSSATYTAGDIDASASTVTPNEIAHGHLEVTGLSPNTVYTALCSATGSRPVYCSIHESFSRHADDSNTGVANPAYFTNEGQILADEVAKIGNGLNAHWRHGATHYLSWVPDWAWTTSGPTISGTSYANMLTDPVPTIDTSYHGTVSRPDAIPVVLAVRAALLTGAGTCSFRLYDGTNSIEIASLTSGSWTTATATMAAGTTAWQMQAKVSSGTWTIEGVSLYQYEA